MSWTMVLQGRTDIVYEELEDKVTQAKDGRNDREQEHIDAAVELFKHLVPNNNKLGCHFSVSGHSGSASDISFNSTCSVYIA